MFLDEISIAILLKMDSIAIRIREARKLKDLSQKKLAENIKVTSSAISQYETSQTEPSIKNLAKIAVALDVSFEWLATGRGEKGIEDFLQKLANNYKKDKRLLLLNNDRAEMLELFEKLPKDWQEKYQYILRATVTSLTSDDKL